VPFLNSRLDHSQLYHDRVIVTLYNTTQKTRAHPARRHTMPEPVEPAAELPNTPDTTDSVEPFVNDAVPTASAADKEYFRRKGHGGNGS